jgi:lysophospholipase L1-like esterase
MRALQRLGYARRRYLSPHVARRVLAIALGCGLAAVTLELLLRFAPFELPLHVDNYVRSCYEPGRVGSTIGFFSARPGVRLHKPHFETNCKFNRRSWRHRSDQLGNRNPEDWERADVLLLGDSMVYGHGVEEAETFASLLRAETGRCVVNAGQTDTSAVEHLVKVRSFVPLLRPKVVLVFLYRNDLFDVRRARTPDQVRALVERGDAPETRTYTPAELFESAEPAPSLRNLFFDRLLIARVALYYWRRGEPDRFAAFWMRDADSRTTNEQALAYQRAALEKMLESARATGSKLVLAYMPTSGIARSTAERRGNRTRREVRAVAESLRLPCFDPSPLFVRADGTSDAAAYLEDDWHLNAEGHRRLAHALAEFLRREGVLD